LNALVNIMTTLNLSRPHSPLTQPLEITEAEWEIAQYIRKYGPLSRNTLASFAGYSRAKVTSLVNTLLESGLLKEVGDGDSHGGRRPRLLNFNDALGYVAGVDIGATSLDIAVADLTGKVISTGSTAADVRHGPEHVLRSVTEGIQAMLAEREIASERLFGIGIGVPGPVEFSSGLLIAPPIMPGWEAFPIRDFMMMDFPNALVIVDNDVNVMALGELRAGAGREVENFLFIKIGTGIGCGIVCQSEIYRGSSGCAGDIGHICVDKQGPICHCGNQGCLEAMAAGPPIAKRAIAAAQNSESATLIRQMDASGGTLTAEDVGIAATHGDRASLEIIQDSGRMIGDVLAGLVNFFNPSLILIGGGVSKIGFQFLTAIRREVLNRSLPLSTQHLEIQYSAMTDVAGTTGAIHLALDHVFVISGGTWEVS
jgi:glucokinase-like ROK family protein